MRSPVYRSLPARRAVERSYREHLRGWTVQSRQRTVATREGDTFVVACGSPGAPPAVLLHGAGSNSAIWRAEAPLWSQSRRLYLVDVIGEPGFSAPARPRLDSDAYARWLDDVLDELGVEAAAVVGVSFGGWVATDYTIRRPHRVERLALRAPGGIGRQRYGAILAALALMPFGNAGTRLALRFALGPGRIPEPVIDYMLPIQRSYRPRRDPLPIFTDEDLRAITAPVFVSLGACDRMLDSQQTSARLARLQPAARVYTQAGVGHGFFGDSQDLHSFLREGSGT